jgi:(p)ppGpp synthase/HD superfamily hydrolase
MALKPDIKSIQTCLLHDVIEDTPITEKDIIDNF